MDDFTFLLCSAATDGDLLTLGKLLRRVPNLDVNTRSPNPYGPTVLSLASKAGHSEVVRLLLEAGAQPNLHDAALVTPLHHAARGNHVRVVMLLLHYGANAELQTKGGVTAMQLAGYETDSWKVLYDFSHGVKPVIPLLTDVVPAIPPFCIPKPLPAELDKPNSKKKKEMKTKKRK
jgi:hypothetical protein